MRRGLRGGGTTIGGGSNIVESRFEVSGVGGRDVMKEGWRWSGKALRRLSVLISSVCTEASLVYVGSRMDTWQPISLKCWGRSGSRGLEGVGGLEVGG